LCRCAECHHVGCHYSKRRYSECRSAWCVVAMRINEACEAQEDLEEVVTTLNSTTTLKATSTCGLTLVQSCSSSAARAIKLFTVVINFLTW
jgi:hypothetical protein